MAPRGRKAAVAAAVSVRNIDNVLQSRKRKADDVLHSVKRARTAGPLSPLKIPLVCKQIFEDDIVKEVPFNPSDPVANAKRVLHVSSVPAHIVGRENEQAAVLSFLTRCVEQDMADSLYVAGAPGTGKTASMREVTADFLAWLAKSRRSATRVVYVNCMTVREPRAIYAHIIESLGVDMSRVKTDAQDTLQRLAVPETKGQKNQPVWVLIADEIDQLASADQEVLYRLFSWAKFPGSRLVLVGIANALDLTERLLPRLSAKKCEPSLLNFAPYSKDEIKAVLLDRLSCIGDAVLDPIALELVSRKVAAHSGDVRKALDICRRSLELAEAEARAAGAQAGRVVKASVAHINKVVQEVYGSPHVAKMRALGLHSKLMLCALFLAIDGKQRDINGSKLHESYIAICRRRSMTPVSMSEFADIAECLCASGIVTLAGGPKRTFVRDIRASKVSPSVHPSDIEFALKEAPMFKAIIDECNADSEKAASLELVK